MCLNPPEIANKIPAEKPGFTGPLPAAGRSRVENEYSSFLPFPFCSGLCEVLMQAGAINHPIGPSGVRVFLYAEDMCCLTEPINASTWKQAITIQLNFRMEIGGTLGFVSVT